jgi:DNA modification methylase
MSWEIIHGDARSLPLHDATVDLIMTSPPYWGLRSYRDGGEHYDGQIGSEPTPQQFADELVGMIDGEWRRVLKPAGSLFLNLGDKYAGAGGGNDNTGLGNPRGDQSDNTDNRGNPRRYRSGTSSARPKSLLGLPWRVALALIDRGWILRSEIIWAKPNGLPESVKDRVRRSHEQVFHLTKEPSYYAAVDEIREAVVTDPARGTGAHPQRTTSPTNKRDSSGGVIGFSPLGRLPGSVWTIPTQPLIIPEAQRQALGLVDHFAAYPPELCRRIILGWSPREVCAVCGEGRRPISERSVEKWQSAHRTADPDSTQRGAGRSMTANRGGADAALPNTVSHTIVGWACTCPTPDAPTTPGVVLDPMCGTGTTIGVAHRLGRHSIGIDLSEDYCRLARWRTGCTEQFQTVEPRTWQERQGTLLPEG